MLRTGDSWCCDLPGRVFQLADGSIGSFIVSDSDYAAYMRVA